MHFSEKRTLALVGTFCALGLALSACATDAESQSTDNGDTNATVIATTTQVGSITEQITACAGGQTTTLMSAGDDPHQFEASSAQMADMVSADLVVLNGLGLESSLQRSLENAETDGAELFEVAPQLDPIPYQEEHHHDHADEHGHAHGHEAEDQDHGSYDSHVWMDVSRMADGAELIGQKLADVTGEDAYVSCGAEVAEDLRATDAQVEELLAHVDSARLVTDHAAYGYLADRYGVEVSGVVIPGGSTDGEPSSQDLSQLTALLNDEGADALVTAKNNPNRMIAALEAETESDVPVVMLYENGIGEPGSGAETYQDAMVYNAEALAEAIN
ncbi:zinc ABC transporter substrate-binding protein AztC [Enteractinococcus fodinae]|uniref:Zinc/manganese transport system substrate-binding protein n=1 Tax=Enteractinococcus fodinae TaxID=684663 RepID=A0ABU2B1X8_9MICC|nr:metal ABC transporter substrate-binding protein [Enteractinococcus fodinae]MDR7346773.1 zinc/manganese transport system substrate-binding protein [Enteractinococcus fodinae]